MEKPVIRVIQRTSKKPTRNLINTTFFYKINGKCICESMLTRTGRVGYIQYKSV